MWPLNINNTRGSNLRLLDHQPFPVTTAPTRRKSFADLNKQPIFCRVLLIFNSYLFAYVDGAQIPTVASSIPARSEYLGF